MQCSNCGKTIPFTGRECPFCHANKEADKWGVVIATIGGIIGFFVGIGMYGTFWGVVGCTVAGLVPGAIIKAAFR